MFISLQTQAVSGNLATHPNGLRTAAEAKIGPRGRIMSTRTANNRLYGQLRTFASVNCTFLKRTPPVPTTLARCWSLLEERADMVPNTIDKLIHPKRREPDGLHNEANSGQI